MQYLCAVKLQFDAVYYFRGYPRGSVAGRLDKMMSRHLPSLIDFLKSNPTLGIFHNLDTTNKDKKPKYIITPPYFLTNIQKPGPLYRATTWRSQI